MKKIVVIIDRGICTEVISEEKMDVIVYDFDKDTDDTLFIKHMDATKNAKTVEKISEIYKDDFGATAVRKDDPLF